jgi:Hint domain
VRWLGKQTVSPIFSDKLKTLPIRIKAGALGENVPSRDLLVSPGHAMFIDGVLIVAGALVNGTSIVRQTRVPAAFVYYHVELNEHALILAENAPAESFVDNVDRENFDNWAEHERLYAHLPPMVEMDYPVAKSHRQVPSAIRQMLAKRAALIADAGQNVA